MQYQLDVTEFICPLPILITKKTLKSLRKGDELQIKANNSISVMDFKLLCEEIDFLLKDVIYQENRIYLTIILQ